MNRKIIIFSLTTIGLAILLIILIKATKRMKYKKWSKQIADLFNYGEAQQNNIAIIIEEYFKHGNNLNQLSYILATARHESRFTPVRETFASTDAKAVANLKGAEYAATINGFSYFGRGFVQLTWLNNYVKMGKRLGIDLAGNPSLALEPKIAAKILVVGMMEGMFTGKKLSDYINENKVNFGNARRVVNGLDRAELISGYAVDINQILTNEKDIA